MSAPEPDDVAMGVATWDVDPFEIGAWPAGQGAGPIGAVSIDGRSVTPAVARRLAAVLLAAADHAVSAR